MSVGVFDMFKVGIGPSSSHTVGPMVAATMFVTELVDAGLFDQVSRVHIQLRGSLGATGRGHGTDKAVLAGLGGGWPATVDPAWVRDVLTQAEHTHQLLLKQRDAQRQRVIGFDPHTDLQLQLIVRRGADLHPNAMILTAFDDAGQHLAQRKYYSIGGGFIATDQQLREPTTQTRQPQPYPFRTGEELLAHTEAAGLSIPQIVLANEAALERSEADVAAKMHEIWDVMAESIRLGCSSFGELPGGLRLRRRAGKLAADLAGREGDPLAILDWVATWAIAVNEQNAAGGRVVTAPTNGAAGIIPAVLKFAQADRRATRTTPDVVTTFLLAAGAIGTIYQQTASISGAEVGCQGEVGVASSMAAAGLAQVLGASPHQVVNAAEIGLEHHLGLTCDPVGGLVQVPCIERNAVGATTAITAARLAVAGDGRQLVSLDQAMETMMATGADMMTKYKETATGGLALSLAEC